MKKGQESIEDFLVKLENKYHVSCLSIHVSRLLSKFFQVSEPTQEGRTDLSYVSEVIFKGLEPVWVESSELFQVPDHLYYIRRLASRFARGEGGLGKSDFGHGVLGSRFFSKIFCP